MIDELESKACEKILLAVLPLFEAAVTDPDPSAIIQVENLSDHERRGRSFCAKFLAEVRKLRKLIKTAEDHKSLNRIADEYVKNLTGILTLFDCHVGDGVVDEVSGLSFQNAVVSHPLLSISTSYRLSTEHKIHIGTQKLGDHRFYRLGALNILIAGQRDGGKFVTPIARKEKQNDNMTRIQKYNRRLERFLGLQSSFAPDTTMNEATKGHPSYVVRQYLDKLHDILTKSWSTCQESPHYAKLRLATFVGKRQTTSHKEELGHCDVDLLLQTHSPIYWQQTRMIIHRSDSPYKRSMHNSNSKY